MAILDQSMKTKINFFTKYQHVRDIDTLKFVSRQISENNSCKTTPSFENRRLVLQILALKPAGECIPVALEIGAKLVRMG